jgi:hypothetical protein
LQDEGQRALAWYREHEGYTKAATTDPDRGPAATERLTDDGDPDEPPAQGDPAGEQALNQMKLAMAYAGYTACLRRLETEIVTAARYLDEARKLAHIDEKQAGKLARLNATVGTCEVCNAYCETGRHEDRLRPLHRPGDDNHDDDLLACHPCAQSWYAAVQRDPDQRLSRWRKARRERLGKDAA